MKYFLIWSIRIYWKIFPEKTRRKCIFKESCSHFVYAKTKEEGLVSGLKALRMRVKQCKPGYRIILLPNNEKVVLLTDDSVVKIEELNVDNL